MHWYSAMKLGFVGATIARIETHRNRCRIRRPHRNHHHHRYRSTGWLLTLARQLLLLTDHNPFSAFGMFADIIVFYRIYMYIKIVCTATYAMMVLRKIYIYIYMVNEHRTLGGWILHGDPPRGDATHKQTHTRLLSHGRRRQHTHDMKRECRRVSPHIKLTRHSGHTLYIAIYVVHN